jgi:HlyD family secretion protein
LIGLAVYQFRFAPLVVETVSPTRKPVLAEVMGTGTLEARVSTTISPKIAGRIAQVLVDQGDQVTQGQLLVQLDDEELKQQVAIAAAVVEAEIAALIRLKADQTRAIALFEQSQRHHARIKSLLDQNAAAVEDLEQAAESMAVATADMARAEAAITEGQKRQIAAEKTLEFHRARLADTTITAPNDGLIVERHREAGEVAVPGSAILTLIATDVLWISAWVDETQMSGLAVDQPARVVFRSQPDQSYPATVTRLGKQADRETREFVVDVLVKELPSNWAVGQRAEVFIETGKSPDALTIPADVLMRQGQEEGVMIVDNGVARWQSISLGIRGREDLEVLEGLSGSERVIRSDVGGRSLVSGQRVRAR